MSVDNKRAGALVEGAVKPGMQELDIAPQLPLILVLWEPLGRMFPDMVHCILTLSHQYIIIPISWVGKLRLQNSNLSRNTQVTGPGPGSR